MRFSRRRRRADEAPDASRLVAWGDQLAKVHRWLLAELATAREHLDDSGSSGGLSPALQAHCLTFCDALDAHHRGEDDGMFPHLAAESPALRPVIERLRREHVTVAQIVRDVRALLDEVDVGHDRADLAAQLDDLTARLQRHFAYEEEQLTGALNALDILPWDTPQ